MTEAELVAELVQVLVGSTERWTRREERRLAQQLLGEVAVLMGCPAKVSELVDWPKEGF